MNIPVMPSAVDGELLRAYLKTVRESENWPAVTVDEDGDGEAEAAYTEAELAAEKTRRLTPVVPSGRCPYCGRKGNGEFCGGCGAPL